MYNPSTHGRNDKWVAYVEDDRNADEEATLARYWKLIEREDKRRADVVNAARELRLDSLRRADIGRALHVHLVAPALSIWQSRLPPYLRGLSPPAAPPSRSQSLRFWIHQRSAGAIFRTFSLATFTAVPGRMRLSSSCSRLCVRDRRSSTPRSP